MREMGGCGEERGKKAEVGRAAGGLGMSHFGEKFSSRTLIDISGGDEPVIFLFFHILLRNLPRLSNYLTFLIQIKCIL